MAGMNWLEVHAPQDEIDAQRLQTPYHKDPGLNRDQSTRVILGNTSAPDHVRQFVDNATAVPEESNNLPVIKSVATAIPVTETASCSNGPVASGAFVWPADNHSLTGNDYGPGHPGIDIAAGEGSPVYAANAGVVIALGNDGAGYGNVIQIDHHNGYFTMYAHLSVIGVSMCQSVEAGQWIGDAGSTGNARGAHLHFEVALDGWAINPWTVLP
jgi:murein DD-endopeptidase MepM/ murein hydrolase activator NlpD